MGDFGKNIQMLRETLKLNQAEFSRKTGITGELLPKIEGGKDNITLKTLLKILKAFPQVDPRWLLDLPMKEKYRKIENPNLGFIAIFLQYVPAEARKKADAALEMTKDFLYNLIPDDKKKEAKLKADNVGKHI